MKRRLTAATVRSLLAKPPEERVDIIDTGDAEVVGLTLRLTTTGAASWSVWHTRPSGGKARYTIGNAREVGLKEARAKAKKVRQDARDGNDPHFDRKAARKKAEQQKQQAKAGTVAELAEQWLGSREAKAWRPVTKVGVESLLRRHVIPIIGKVAAVELTKADVRAVIERAHDKTAYGSNRAFGVLRLMYNWARSKDLVTTSPCDGVRKIEKEKRRDKVYKDEELRAIVAAVEGTDLEDLYALVMRTGARSHEARSARWSEIDFDRRVWAIPAESAKGDRKHEVPLAPGAWAIIEARRRKHGKKSPFVFPAATGPCSICTQVGHASPPLQRRVRALSIKAGFMQNTGIEKKPKWEGAKVRLHDIRRTVADRMLHVLDLEPHVVDLGVMGHAPAGLISTYMPSGVSLTKVQTALSAWDAHLDQILAGESKKPMASVTAISKGRRRA